MQPDADLFAFEKFPRGYLNFTVSRRQFLPTLIKDFLVSCERDEGKPVRKLSELGVRPDEELGPLCPRVVPGCKITVQEGMVWGQPPRALRPIRIFPVESPALIAFNLFNGKTPLAQAAEQVAEENGWDADRSFAYVRGFFLWLVLVRVCQPAHP